MPTRNVNLSEQQARFVQQSVEGGDFRNASEVVRAGLRLLEQQRQMDKLKLQMLRKLSKQAFDEIDQGEFDLVDPENLDRFMAKVSSRQNASKSR